MSEELSPEEMASFVKKLGEIEVLSRILIGHLPPDKLTNKDFMYGVSIGIIIATDRIGESIPEHLRKIVRDAIVQGSKQDTN